MPVVRGYDTSSFGPNTTPELVSTRSPFSIYTPLTNVSHTLAKTYAVCRAYLEKLSKVIRLKALLTRRSNTYCVPGFCFETRTRDIKRNVSTVLSPKHSLWDNRATLSYSFTNGSEIQRTKCERVLNEIAARTNLHFLKAEEGVIRIGFSDSNSSWTFVGINSLSLRPGEPTMSLGAINGHDLNLSKNEEHILWHEFSHALGLEHHHLNPPWYREITFSPRGGDDTQSLSWKFKDVDNIPGILRSSPLVKSSRYNSISVVMYFTPAENVRRWEDGSCCTLDIDKGYLALHYPGPLDERRRALDLLGVECHARDFILPEDNPNDVRWIFMEWTHSSHAGGEGKHRRPWLRYLK